ncbi:DUF6912 family protein, partial [Amycolatopsis solani]|uniref:DUF6912 family protein n=1 Tax=Amycolatopsis solani TaxID=3028615 RepID=UPI0025AF1BA6
MRVYLPATIAMLRDLESSGEFRARSGTAFALTPALREAYVSGSDEELEYAALLDAARASLRLIAAEEKGEPRRVVISADVEGVTLRPDLDAPVVRIGGPIPLKAVAAIHVDAPEAAEAVTGAAAGVGAAGQGGPG